MAFDVFAFLDGISPWWWVALALALGAVEVMTFTYFLLWPALAAATVAVVLFISPAMTGATQALTFAILTLIYAVAGWGALRRMRASGDEAPAGLNQRSARLIGRRVKVEETFSGGIGWVRVDGERWRARLADDSGASPGPGSELEVTSAEGMTLIVSRPKG